MIVSDSFLHAVVTETDAAGGCRVVGGARGVLSIRGPSHFPSHDESLTEGCHTAANTCCSNAWHTLFSEIFAPVLMKVSASTAAQFPSKNSFLVNEADTLPKAMMQVCRAAQLYCTANVCLLLA